MDRETLLDTGRRLEAAYCLLHGAGIKREQSNMSKIVRKLHDFQTSHLRTHASDFDEQGVK